MYHIRMNIKKATSLLKELGNSLRQTVIFVDLGGTIATSPVRMYIFPEVAQEISEKAKVSLAEVTSSLATETRQRRSMSHADVTWVMDWDSIVDTVARYYGVRINESILARTHRYAKTTYCRILDSANIHLMQLRDSGNRRIVLASMALLRYHSIVIDALEITGLFSDILTPDTTGFLKTSPNFYRSFIDRVGDNHLFVNLGDNFEDDVVSPSQLGFMTILKMRTAVFPELDPFERANIVSLYTEKIHNFNGNFGVVPNAVINNIGEIHDVVERLEGASCN